MANTAKWRPSITVLNANSKCFAGFTQQQLADLWKAVPEDIQAVAFAAMCKQVSIHKHVYWALYCQVLQIICTPVHQVENKVSSMSSECTFNEFVSVYSTCTLIDLDLFFIW